MYLKWLNILFFDHQYNNCKYPISFLLNNQDELLDSKSLSVFLRTEVISENGEKSDLETLLFRITFSGVTSMLFNSLIVERTTLIF